MHLGRFRTKNPLATVLRLESTSSQHRIPDQSAARDNRLCYRWRNLRRGVYAQERCTAPEEVGTHGLTSLQQNIDPSLDRLELFIRDAQHAGDVVVTDNIDDLTTFHRKIGSNFLLLAQSVFSDTSQKRQRGRDLEMP